MPHLLDPVTIGDLSLRNRIVMAPMTRCRAPGAVPNDMMIQYYTQRAAAGMILTEGVPVSPIGTSGPDVPGIWNDAQTAGWARLTAALRPTGTRMVAQLWHVGRVTDAEFTGGALPVSASAIAAKGMVSGTGGQRPFQTPRALETDEVPGIVEEFRQAAIRAKAAGFDGVELHGANGYLLDQFLQDSMNHRTDRYGGSIENRARLMLDATDACVEVWGAKRVGMHLATRGDARTMEGGDSNPLALFSHVAEQLDRRGIAFICTREARRPDSIGPTIRKLFRGSFIANQQFDRESGEAELARGDADAVAYGIPFIANPDLVQRFAEKAPLNAADPATFYTGGAVGYIDYPTIGQSARAA